MTQAKYSHTEMLDHVEASVHEALDACRQREKEFEEFLNAARTTERPTYSWHEGLSKYYELVRQLQEVSEKADIGVAEVDAALAEGEKGFQDWIADTERAQEKLAMWLEQCVR